MERRRVGEALLLLLDRLDDMGKPELVARVFRALIRGQVDRPTFQLMGSAIGSPSHSTLGRADRLLFGSSVTPFRDGG